MWLYAKVFFTKFGAWCPLARQKGAIRKSFLHEKRIFHQISHYTVYIVATLNISSLHYSWADKKATLTTTDNSGMNPFMLAVEKGHLDVVTAMISKDPDLVTWPVGFGSTMIHWALEDGHHRNTFFQVCYVFLVNSFLFAMQKISMFV